MAGHRLEEGSVSTSLYRDPEQPHKGASAPPTPLCILCPLSSHTNLSGPGLFLRLGASRARSESFPSPAWVFHPTEYK